eukprot:5135791-Prymnesium_polylepis.1
MSRLVSLRPVATSRCMSPPGRVKMQDALKMHVATGQGRASERARKMARCRRRLVDAGLFGLAAVPADHVARRRILPLLHLSAS